MFQNNVTCNRNLQNIYYVDKSILDDDDDDDDDDSDLV